MRWTLGLVVAMLTLGVPLLYANKRAKVVRALRVVEEGVLYRSGQLSRDGLNRVVVEYGIKTVVSLRYAEGDRTLPPDAAEEEWCRERGIRYVRIRPREWSSATGEAPAEVGVRQFLGVMDDPANHPVLIHCYAGVHRTGAHCAIYRMEYQGWRPENALKEMVWVGYDHLDTEPDVREYLSAYRPRSVSQELNGQ